MRDGGAELVGADGFCVDGGAVGVFGGSSEFGAMPSAGRAGPTKGRRMVRQKSAQVVQFMVRSFPLWGAGVKGSRLSMVPVFNRQGRRDYLARVVHHQDTKPPRKPQKFLQQ